MKKALITILAFCLCFVGFAAVTVIDPDLLAEMSHRSDSEPIEVVVLMKAQYDRSQLSRQAEYCPTKATENGIAMRVVVVQ